MRHAIAMFTAWTTSHEDSLGSFTSGMISSCDRTGLLRNDRSSAYRESMADHFRWVDDLIEAFSLIDFVTLWSSPGSQRLSWQDLGRNIRCTFSEGSGRWP